MTRFPIHLRKAYLKKHCVVVRDRRRAVAQRQPAAAAAPGARSSLQHCLAKTPLSSSLGSAHGVFAGVKPMATFGGMIRTDF